MKKVFLGLALMFLAGAVRAQTQVYTSISSATWCYITVSTSVPTRVDNFSGLCEGLMTGRTGIRIIAAAGTIHGGFDTTLSTQVESTKYGDVISTSAPVELGLSSAMKYYLFSEYAATEPKVVIWQFRPNASR